MKSSSAPNKTPSLKKGLWPFFLLPLFPPFFLLCFFPALCCFYFTLGKHACLICTGGPPRKDDSGIGVSVRPCVFVCLRADNTEIAHCIHLTVSLAFFELLLLILMRAHTCMDRSQRCVCWCLRARVSC